MAAKIADLLPMPVEVSVGKGKLVLRHLELQEIVQLLFQHSDTFLAMYMESESPAPNYFKFLTLAPDLCATTIAMASDDLENANDYRKLPFSVQLIALEQVWRISVPDPKGLGEMFKNLMNELKHLSEQAEKLEPEEPKPQ